MKAKGAQGNTVRLVVLGLALSLAAAGPVVGQDVAAGQATANVLTGLSVVATQDLEFGDLLQGVAKSVAYSDDDLTAGIFTITGNGGSGIDVYLTMPDYLALADGSDRLVVAFSSTDCAVDENNLTPTTVAPVAGKVPCDPHNLPSTIVVGAAPLPGTTRVYLGGRVVPSVDQKPGAYSGDIICSVAYNGT